uniref:Uncharacterized protein n=1 Tax=Anguilla anguilla TaxID=7936 RepID=A0A0E9WGQ1_ANGAN
MSHTYCQNQVTFSLEQTPTQAFRISVNNGNVQLRNAC